MGEAADEVQLRPGLRAELERVGAAVLQERGLAKGRSRLVLEFVDLQLKWWEPHGVRLPPSLLDDLARGAGAGGSAGE